MNKKFFFRTLMLLLPIFVVVVVVLLFIKANQQMIMTSFYPQPTPSLPTPTAEPFVPSKWANDDQVLAIESNIATLEKDLESNDLDRHEILPPVLDLNINF